MDLHFHPSKGKPFEIEVGYFDTVLEIKEKILKIHSIPISNQTLLFKGNTLYDDLNIHNSDILDKSHIDIHITPDDSPNPNNTNTFLPTNIQLQLKTLMSKPDVTLEMDLADTIGRVKDKIHELEPIPTNLFVIHKDGAELPDHRTLQECGLSDNSEVSVALRLMTRPPLAFGESSGSFSKKLRINVVAKYGSDATRVEVNAFDNVGELRNKLMNRKKKKRLKLPQDVYFFVHKQNVMDDEKSFNWHHVCQSDTIEIVGGSVVGGS